MRQQGGFSVQNSATAGESLRVRVSNRSSLVDSNQELALRATLSHAVGLVADCFDNCNRQAETGSIFSLQARRCEENYAAVDNHKTTLTYTSNLASSLIHNGLDHLMGATDATLDSGSIVRWSSLTLTRSLIEASVECLWLVDPVLDLDTRLRRTNQMFVRSCDEMLRILPGDNETTPRLLSIDPAANTKCLEARDAALKWAIAQDWTCDNGKTITRGRWIGAIPSYRETVALAAHRIPALAAQGGQDYWKDVYSMLSSATHSQPLLMALSIRDEPDALLDRSLMVLDFGVSFYTHALRQYAGFMGWEDHDIDNWFGPVHATLQHMRFPENAPLPIGDFRHHRCEACPEYKDPGMHRLALVSHLCALLERNVDRGKATGAEAPTRYTSAIEFLNEFQHALMNEDNVDPETIEMRKLGVEHFGPITMFGSDLREVLTSIAASWAVLSSPSYQSDVGKIQGWISQHED